MSEAVFKLRSQPAVSRAVVAMLIRHGAGVNLGSRRTLRPNSFDFRLLRDYSRAARRRRRR